MCLDKTLMSSYKKERLSWGTRFRLWWQIQVMR